MNYALLLIPILFFVAIYIQKKKKTGLKEKMSDYRVAEVRKELEWLAAEDKPIRSSTCNLYKSKPGSVVNPPAFLDHDKEVWINSKLLRKKVDAIRKSNEDKATWEYVKMNTYNKNTSPYDPTEHDMESQLTMEDQKEVVINPIVTSFDFPDLSPTNKNPYGTLHGIIEDSTDAMAAPKPDYVFSKSYGFRNYK